MIKNENINFFRIEEMAEDDLEFQSELLNAIHTAILDLQSKYLEGIEQENAELLQQARHKIKPTIGMFELKKMQQVLSEGKLLVNSKGFTSEMQQHKLEFIIATKALLKDLKDIIASQKQ